MALESAGDSVTVSVKVPTVSVFISTTGAVSAEPAPIGVNGDNPLFTNSLEPVNAKLPDSRSDGTMPLFSAP